MKVKFVFYIAFVFLLFYQAFVIKSRLAYIITREAIKHDKNVDERIRRIVE